MSKNETTIKKLRIIEELEPIKFSIHDTWTPKEFISMINKAKNKYSKTHKDIKIGFGYDYAHCYYESDTPDYEIQFTGVKND